MTAPPAPVREDLHAAPREARRRRLQSLGLSSSVTVLGCAALLALSTTTGGDVLGRDPGPRVGPQDGADPLVVPQQSRAPGRAAAPRPDVAAAAQPYAQASRQPATDAAPAVAAPTPAPATSSAPMMREGPDFVVSPRTTCTVGGRTLCTGLDVTPTGDTFQVEAHLCSHGPSPVVLRFADSLEVDLTVGPAGAFDWRWSDTQVVDPTPHTLRLEQGQCWRWTTTYDGRDAGGQPLPAGNHRMTAEFLAEDLGNARAASTEFPVQS